VVEQQNGNGGTKVFLTAPKDLQRTATYERLLDRLTDRYGEEAVLADRDLFGGTADWRERWKEVYGQARLLYVLVREDGTVGLGVWKQTRFLLQQGVPALAVLEGAEDMEHEEISLTWLERKDDEGREDLVRFATVGVQGGSP
jgi:hypothetical protein